jgi:hypothetical protein
MRGGQCAARSWPRGAAWSLLAGAALVATSACAGEEEAAVATVAAATGLDFDYFVSNVEPIFTRRRGSFSVETPGEPSCVMCHTWQTNAPLKLEPLDEGPDGETFWTREQSRKNFVEVARLVTPGDPDNSRLLKAPLALRADGRGGHTGGVFWASKDDPEWQTMAEWVRMASPAEGTDVMAEAAPTVDFEFFQSCVQRVFVTTTPGALPCTECHGGGTAGFARPVGDGRDFWDEEESRLNFRVAMRLIEPGEPTRSRLLMHPLAYEGGGDYTHNGPRRWRSMDDPEWQMLAAWVRGERTGSVCAG